MADTLIVCILGESTAPGTRSECPESLHDWPLPDGYTEAHSEASWRLTHGWAQGRPCESCGRYGWRKVGKLHDGQRALPVGEENHPRIVSCLTCGSQLAVPEARVPFLQHHEDGSHTARYPEENPNG